MADKVMFDFLARLIVKEGGWVIEPVRAAMDGDSYLRDLLGRLRTIPARIQGPDPKRRYRFAERGEHGTWYLVWIPDEK